MSDAKNSPIAPERYGHHGKAGTSVEGHGDAFVRQVTKLNFFVFVIKAKTCLRQHIQSNESGQGYSQFAFEARKIVDLHRQKLGPHGTEFDLGDDRSLRWDHLAGCAQSRSAGLRPSRFTSLALMMLGAAPVSRRKFWCSNVSPNWPTATTRKWR